MARLLLHALRLSVLLLILLATLAMAGKTTNPKNPPKNAILVSTVESLTLRSGRMTAHRRVPAVPQLSCVGPPSICNLYTIDVMRCTNEGADYTKEDIQWACRADLPEEFKLGSTDVACEGYASSDDSFVLKGSCGVEYRLVLTEKGEKRFGNLDDGYPWGGLDGGGQSGTLAKVVFFIIFGFVLLIIIYGFCKACQENPPRLDGGGARRGGGGQPPWYGGGGGGGDDGFDDPPPPYDSHGYFQRPKKPRSSNNRTGTGSSSGSRQQQQEGWRPGPWTAGLAGAGLGYALGRGQNRTQPRQNVRQGGFFGNGGGPSTSPSSSSPPTFSSSRHSSTGFGGTSRR